MFLRYLRNGKYIFLLVYFLSAFSVDQVSGAGAGAGATMDLEATYPLGGTWRSGLGESYNAVHEKLCAREMTLFDMAAKGVPGAYLDESANVATFELRGTKPDNTQVVLLETEPNFCFLSGKICGDIAIGDSKVNFTVLDPGTRSALASAIKKPDDKDLTTVGKI